MMHSSSNKSRRMFLIKYVFILLATSQKASAASVFHESSLNGKHLIVTAVEVIKQ